MLTLVIDDNGKAVGFGFEPPTCPDCGSEDIGVIGHEDGDMGRVYDLWECFTCGIVWDSGIWDEDDPDA